MVNQMSFNDLLNQDLPSRMNKSFMENNVDDDSLDEDAYLESLLDNIDVYDENNNEDEDFMKDKGKSDKTDIPGGEEPPEDESKLDIKEEFGDWDDDDLEDLVGDDDEDDVDSMSDDELEQLDQELSGKMIDSVTGKETPQKLTPDEEMQADDMMSVAATTAIINDEMNADEKKNFIESQRDVQIAINEGLLLESDVHDIADASFLNESKYGNKMVIRLDKNSKMKQLYAIGVNVSAAAHKDPDYYKYKKVNRMKKILQTKLRKKYHAEALKRMRVYMKRLSSSKSKPLSDLGKKITKGKK